MLLAAQRPVMLVGQGVRYGGAADELRKLAERLQIPVAASASGLRPARTATSAPLGRGAEGARAARPRRPRARPPPAPRPPPPRGNPPAAARPRPGEKVGPGVRR